MRVLPVGLLSRLREALEESHVPYVVQIIDLSQVDEEFARNVRSEGVLWLDTSKSCNYLYYNPTRAEYKMQGRSMEIGLARYVQVM
jgi:hypothetical protein